MVRILDERRRPGQPGLIGWLGAAAMFLAVIPAPSAATLARLNGRPPESHPGIVTEYGTLVAADGTLLRTVITRPQTTTDKLPALLFLQWLSCDTVELPETGGDGWTAMMRRLIRESGAIVWRTEKRGVGDSQGRCETLDYETELADHRAAFTALRQRADVDPARIIVFGASIGATYAPQVAAGKPLAGVMVWGGGSRSWLERQIAFDRRAMELSGRPAGGIAAAMRRHIEFQTLYLAGQQTPQAIIEKRPDLAETAGQVIGLEGPLHYGRPLSFHWQAQKQDWAAAWEKLDAPVLVLLGEYDWFEEPRSVKLIADIVNRRRARNAQFHLIPGMDHHFALFDSAEAAFAGTTGVPEAGPVLNILLPWLHNRLR